MDLVRKQPGLVLYSGLSSVLFAVLVALAAYGAWAMRRQTLVLAAFVLYVIATAQSVDAAQSRHRAPAEFALCLLAVAAFQKRKPRGR